MYEDDFKYCNRYLRKFVTARKIKEIVKNSGSIAFGGNNYEDYKRFYDYMLNNENDYVCKLLSIAALKGMESLTDDLQEDILDYLYDLVIIYLDNCYDKIQKEIKKGE